MSSPYKVSNTAGEIVFRGTSAECGEFTANTFGSFTVDFDYETFIKNAIAASPIEARIVRKVYKALKDAGKPIVSVYDGGERVPVRTRQEVLEQVFNLDESYLYTEDGAWVRLVMGNEWDVICDYTVNLEDALQPVNDYINRHN